MFLTESGTFLFCGEMVIILYCFHITSQCPPLVNYSRSILLCIGHLLSCFHVTSSFSLCLLLWCPIYTDWYVLMVLSYALVCIDHRVYTLVLYLYIATIRTMCGYAQHVYCTSPLCNYAYSVLHSGDVPIPTRLFRST
jgi:hypothetical protein